MNNFLKRFTLRLYPVKKDKLFFCELAVYRIVKKSYFIYLTISTKTMKSEVSLTQQMPTFNSCHVWIQDLVMWGIH